MDTVINLKELGILLAEDSEVNRIMARKLLSDKVKFMDEASNGKEAVTYLTEHDANYYSLILMDIEMPIMDGYEATRAIRALDNKDISNIPIIAVSSNTSEEDVKEAYSAGMNAYIFKPIAMEPFLNALYKVMNTD